MDPLPRIDVCDRCTATRADACALMLWHEQVCRGEEAALADMVQLLEPWLPAAAEHDVGRERAPVIFTQRWMARKKIVGCCQVFGFAA